MSDDSMLRSIENILAAMQEVSKINSTILVFIKHVQDTIPDKKVVNDIEEKIKEVQLSIGKSEQSVISLLADLGKLHKLDKIEKTTDGVDRVLPTLINELDNHYRQTEESHKDIEYIKSLFSSNITPDQAFVTEYIKALAKGTYDPTTLNDLGQQTQQINHMFKFVTWLQKRGIWLYTLWMFLLSVLSIFASWDKITNLVTAGNAVGKATGTIP